MRSGETVFFNASNAALISAPTNGMKPPGRSVGPVPEARRVKKPSGGLACFRSAGANRAEYDSIEHPVRVLHRQSQDRTAAADLNIIRVTTQTQNLARFARRPVQTQGIMRQPGSRPIHPIARISARVRSGPRLSKAAGPN